MPGELNLFGAHGTYNSGTDRTDDHEAERARQSVEVDRTAD
jgi:hypothetical protein